MRIASDLAPSAHAARRLTLLAGTGALLAFGSPAQAQRAPTVGPLVKLAYNSIFRYCTIDKVASQPGVNYPNALVEPNFDINPANPDNFLVGVQQDRWNNGGARGLRGAYSRDGGVTWNIGSTPNVTKCQGGPWPRSSDPWVTFSPDGTAYFSSLVTEELADPNLFGHNGQTISQSVDGGAHWFPPFTLIDTPAQPDVKKPQILNDKNAVTADPRDSRYVYAVWDQLASFTPGFGVADDSGNPNPDQGPPAPPIPHAGAAHPADATGAPVGHPDVLTITRHLRDQGRSGKTMARARTAVANAGLPAYPVYVRGPTYFSRTRDHGYTWEPAHIIYDPGANNQTIGNQIVVGADGTVVDFFTQQNDLTGADQIGWVASNDHGQTFTAKQLVHTLVGVPTVTPNKGEAIRSADIIFSLAVDRTNGVYYLVWQDSRYSGVSEVVFSYSTDLYSWSTPVRVNQTPRRPETPLFQQALTPAVAVGADGSVVITYYDFRYDKPGASTDLTDVWAVTCNPITSSDSCTSNSDWATEVRLTDTSFDFNRAAFASGHFVGDYQGLKAVGNVFHPVFGLATNVNRSSIFTRTLTVPTASAAASVASK